MFDVSDEATGLPPLHEIAPEDSILALTWQLGPEGLVTFAGEDSPVPVKYVSFRGMILDEGGNTHYGQIHVALPHDAVGPFLEQWAEVLDGGPRGTDEATDSPRLF